MTDTEILVGTHQPLTGPAAAGYGKIAPATKAYFDYVNANGGVNGRKITYKIVDDGYNPANTLTVVRQLVLQDKVFAILNGLGTPTHTGVLDFLKENKIPDLFVASGSDTGTSRRKYPSTFGYQTDYTIEGKILGDYIKKNFAGKKVCFFGQDDDFGRDSLDGSEDRPRRDPVADQTPTPSARPASSAQITKFKAAGCEVVVIATLTGFTALAIAHARRARPSSRSGSPRARAATTTRWSTGAALRPTRSWPRASSAPATCRCRADTTNPWIAGFKKINDEYNNGDPFDGNVLYGMSVGYLFVQALLKAGKNLTREGLLAAVEKGGFKGPGFVPLGYSATNHAGYTGCPLTKVTNGVQAYFGDAHDDRQQERPGHRVHGGRGHPAGGHDPDRRLSLGTTDRHN